MNLYLRIIFIFAFSFLLFVTRNHKLFTIILLLYSIAMLYVFFIDFFYKKELYKLFAYIINNKKLPNNIKRFRGMFQGVEELTIMLFDEISIQNYALKELAFRDPLTNLYNLLYFEEHLKDILSSFRNDKIPSFMIDIDNFKQINDKFGHLVGDNFLREFSTEMRSLLKNSKNITFRYGGDEFVILFDEPFEKAKKIMEDLRKSFEKKVFKIDKEKIRITLSIGGGLFTWDEMKDIKAVLKTLDQKLYKAKEKKNFLYI
ncbi:MAG: GGDEF domain-containing protein [Candidatus Hydrothermales bacterium]